jgi:ABC-2 type transport system permease protein
MNWNSIRALVVKDLSLFFRNRFFAFTTMAALVAYIVIYMLLPSEVDETLRIGFLIDQLPEEFTEQLSAEGLVVYYADSEAELRQAVLDAEITAGFAFPEDFWSSLARGSTPEVEAFFPADLPQEAKDIYVLMLKELTFTMIGQPLNIDVEEEILGEDLVGQQIPLRDRMLPMIAVFILIFETLGLANLLSGEIEARTLEAILITPLRVRELFTGKSITGIGMAFFQALILVAITGGLSNQAGIVLLALFLGALLATGVGFLLASTGKDMMGILAWGILAILILILPALGIVFPGTITDWVKLVPSYYLVDTLNRAFNYGISTQLALTNMAILLVVDMLILWLGITALRRKIA